MQPLALVVLGISELPQPMHLASTRMTLVKIVLSQVELLTGCSRCNMAYPAKRMFRRKQKRLRRKWRCNRLRSKYEESSPNCSDSEASSSSQSSSTVEAEDVEVESDLEDLEEHYYSDLRRYSAFLEAGSS